MNAATLKSMKRELLLAASIVVLIVAVGMRAPVFVTGASLANLLTDSTLLIMLALAQMLVIVMTGTIIPPEEEALCEEHNFPVLRKPFLASGVMNQIRSRLTPAGVSRGA